MNSAPTVLNALVNLVGTITVANGYANTVKLANVRPYYDSLFLKRTEDSTYPKICVMMLSGDDQRQPGLSRLSHYAFAIILVVKQMRNTDPSAHDQTLVWLEDFRRMVFNNSTLGGKVTCFDLTDYHLDGGALHPEGSLILRLETEGHEFSD